jgi:hypothetical protein
VVIDDRDIGWSPLRPGEADPPLVINPNTPLALSISRQGLEPIAWRRSEIVESRSPVQKTQLPKGDVLNITRKPSDPEAGPNFGRFPVEETDDQNYTI